MLVMLNALQAGNRSGTGVYTEQLARRLPGHGGDTEVLVAWPKDLPDPGGPAECMRRPSRGHLGRIIDDQFGLPDEARRRGVDILHYPANVGLVRAGAVKTVVTVHDLSFYREPGWFGAGRATYYRYAVRRSLRHAARVIAVSRATADEIVEVLGFPAGRIDVIHNGVDERFQPASPDRCAEVRRKYGLPEHFFLFTGTHEPRKNLVRLVEAWSSIARTCSMDLVLAGRAGWKTDGLDACIASSPYSDRIIRCGYVDDTDLPAVMSTAEVFVYPSLYEGFGIPVIEAMACGTPVLTSNRSSLPEVTGAAALLVDPERVDAIADGLAQLEQDEAFRKDLASRGRERAADFSWERTAVETVACYRRSADASASAAR